MSLNSIFTQETNEVKINVENLSKSWVISSIINPGKTEDELKEIFSLVESTSLQLNNDLTCVFSFILDLPGTWKLKEQVIIMNNKRGQTKWIIHSLNTDELTLSRYDSKQKLVFKPKE